MKYILTCVCCFLFINNISGQVDQIKKIKELYYEVNEDNYLYHDLELKYVFAAIGEQTKKIRFYYIGEQTNPEIDPYEMNYVPVKAEIRFNISASVFYTLEYVYDQNGNLVFYFEKKEGYENSEKRYYFIEEKLIKCIIKENIGIENSVEYTDTNSFKNEDQRFAETILLKSERYKQLFFEINEGSEID